MTDHPTPATPEATEREARERVESMMDVGHDMNGPIPRDALDAIHAYRAAVAAVEYERGRRAERDRLVEIVEGMRKKREPMDETNYIDCHCVDAHNAALAALLDRLREGA